MLNFRSQVGIADQNEDMAREEVNELMAKGFGDPLPAQDVLPVVDREEPAADPLGSLVLKPVGYDFPFG